MDPLKQTKEETYRAVRLQKDTGAECNQLSRVSYCVSDELYSLAQTGSDWWQRAGNLSAFIKYTAVICKPLPVCVIVSAASLSQTTIVWRWVASHQVTCWGVAHRLSVQRLRPLGSHLCWTVCCDYLRLLTKCEYFLTQSLLFPRCEDVPIFILESD